MGGEARAEQTNSGGSRTNRPVSRRQFLKLLIASTVGVGAAGVLPRHQLTGLQSGDNPCGTAESSGYAGTRSSGDASGMTNVEGWRAENNGLPEFDRFTVPGTNRELPVEQRWSLDFSDTGYRSEFTDDWKLGTGGDKPVSSPSISSDGAVRAHIGEGDSGTVWGNWNPQKAGMAGTPWEQMMVDWWLYVGEGNATGDYHSKIWGILNTKDNTGVGHVQEGDGWSSRITLDNGVSDTPDGRIGLQHYHYHEDMTPSSEVDGMNYGEADIFGTIPLEEWVRIRHYVHLNSAGDAADGVCKVWLNNQLAYENTSIRWSDSPDTFGCWFRWQVYYGGGPPAPSARNIYFDELNVLYGPLDQVL